MCFHQDVAFQSCRSPHESLIAKVTVSLAKKLWQLSINYEKYALFLSRKKLSSDYEMKFSVCQKQAYGVLQK